MEMTKLMREQVREAELEFNYSFENGCEGSIFNRRYEFAEKRFDRVIESMIRDLATVEALGFIDCYEKRELVDKLQTAQRATALKHRQILENKLGTREYTIQYILYNGWAETREEAEKQYDEEWA